ncbi:MAG: CBS domain-containing protein [Burkholderiales bacterium]|nr:CBS domain-containing protein [Burkholderiales bacterium]
MRIRDICSRVVVVTEPGTDLRQAARLMRDHHVGALVIVDGTEAARRPRGIVTDRDIVVAVVAAPGVKPEALTVGDVMSADLIVAGEDLGVFEAVDLMQERGARRLPVVDADGRLVGIVTLDDVLRMVAGELTALAIAAQRSFAREVHERRAIED